MTARPLLAPLLLALASGAAACGGGGDDIDCSYDDSCGGDPVGDWDIAGACTAPEEAETLPNCPEATSTVTNAVGGRWSFQPDQDFSYDLETTQIYSLQAPLACLNDQRDDEQLPVYATCEEIRGEGLLCSTQGMLCSCTLVTTSTTELDGNWVVVDSTLTLTDEFGGTLATYDYCREDEATLKLVLNSFEEVPTVLVLEK